MKKLVVFLCGILSLFLITGCDKKKDAISKLDDIVKNESYYLEGKLEIVNNEDKYNYDVFVSYKKGDFYKVELINLVNNHKQIILKNNDGVYVLTPSLNKSFKFQSDWPYNNSQIYLIQNIVDDIKNDENRIIDDSNSFIITSKVNYTNNKKITKQKVYLNDNIDKVEVLDDNDNIIMTMEFTNIQYNKSFDDNYFDLDTSMTVSANLELKKAVDQIVYPMYMPKNTSLTNQNKIETDNGERVILTFSGDKSFMLVESTVDTNNLLLPVFGDIAQINDTLGVVNDTSLNWFNNEIEYYLTSNDMSQDELLTVANSLSTIMVGK